MSGAACNRARLCAPQNKDDCAAVTYPAKGIFVGRPQSLFSTAVSFFLFFVIAAGVAAVGVPFASTSGLCLS